jgi:hypothetical protein
LLHWRAAAGTVVRAARRCKSSVPRTMQKHPQRMRPVLRFEQKMEDQS